MVPEFRPAEAFVLMESWLARQALPAYVKPPPSGGGHSGL